MPSLAIFLYIDLVMVKVDKRLNQANGRLKAGLVKVAIERRGYAFAAGNPS